MIILTDDFDIFKDWKQTELVLPEESEFIIKRIFSAFEENGISINEVRHRVDKLVGSLYTQFIYRTNFHSVNSKNSIIYKVSMYSVNDENSRLSFYCSAGELQNLLIKYMKQIGLCF